MRSQNSRKNIKIVLLKVVNEENAWNDLENPCENLGNNQGYRDKIKEIIQNNAENP